MNKKKQILKIPAFVKFVRLLNNSATNSDMCTKIAHHH